MPCVINKKQMTLFLSLFTSYEYPSNLFICIHNLCCQTTEKEPNRVMFATHFENTLSY